MIEFAFVAVVSVFLFTGLLAVLVMALGSFQNNIATESAGRILDGNQVLIEENFRTLASVMDPSSADEDNYLLPTEDFENVTAQQVYRFLTEYPVDGDFPNPLVPDDEGGPVLYDESRLVLSRVDWFNRANLDLPTINRSLLGQYIFDPDLVIDGQDEQGAFRFPGAVVTNSRTGNRTVLVPLLPQHSASGGVGESGIGRTFHVASADPEFFFPVSQDWVAPVVIGKEQDGDGFEFRVIMFHPSQPAVLQYREFETADGEESFELVAADDSEVRNTIGLPHTDYALVGPQPVNPAYSGSSASRGEYGLGELGLAPVGPAGRDGSPPPIPARTVRPFRLVFETSSLFRMGAHLNPIAVKYEADGIAIPLDDDSVDAHTADAPVAPFVDHDGDGQYDDNSDQSLDYAVRVLDRVSDALRRYHVDLDMTPTASSDNDFVENVIQLLLNDDGMWRVGVSAQFRQIAADGPKDMCFNYGCTRMASTDDYSTLTR